VTWHQSTFAELWPTVAQPFSDPARVRLDGARARCRNDADRTDNNKRTEAGELPSGVMDTAA
jgi:hypothetical protein